MYCDCKEKRVLVKGDAQHIAEETFCPKHGYQNSCYLCNSNNFTTERCRTHQNNSNYLTVIPISGPGSMTCDRAGPVTIEDCKTCWGTGGCTYGKTEQEYQELLDAKGE